MCPAVYYIDDTANYTHILNFILSAAETSTE